MARVSLWRQYSNLTRRQRRTLERKARKGDADSARAFRAYSNSIRNTANRRLRELEKAGLDYGPAYNNFVYYLQTQFDGRTRVPTLRQLDFDITEQMWVNEFAVKFLKSNLSSVKGMETANYYRIQTLQDYEVLPTEIEKDGEYIEANWKHFDDFLRFLGSEEVATGIDDYGESDRVVEMLWDYWNRFDEANRGSNIMMIKRAFAQYNAKEMDFAEAMRKVGLKIEDYRGRK